MIQSNLLRVRRWVAVTSLIALNILFTSLSTAQQAPNAVYIEVDLNEVVGEMYPMWAYFGYDEPNYTYMDDGKKLISEIGELSPVPVYFRAHSLLNTDEGRRAALKWGSTNAYTEDENGNPVYDWTIVDRIFDTYLERGGKPLVEIGFMPKALSSNPEPYRHHWSPDQPYGNIYTGWAYPPNDYEKWAELVYQWVRHSVERYGEEEVETWWWEPWNEPDISYWQGSREEYFKLYDYTVDAVKRALPAARVGGPTTTNPGLKDDRSGQFLRDFLEHCLNGTNYATGETGSPLDYISFHAKGDPDVVEAGYVQMDMGQQLEAIAAGFQIVASFPEYRDLPIIIGETDPEGCAACSMDLHPQNAYRNGTMYSSYTASSFAKMYQLADEYGVNFEGALSWSFQFEDQPWFSGFRSMATNGVAKPVLNVFRMFGMMGGDRVAVSQENPVTVHEVIEQGVRGVQADINALASKEEEALYVMVWNYHDDDVPAPAAWVSIHAEGIPAKEALLHHYRIDATHSNSYTVWREMGAPQQMTREMYATLEQSGELALLTSPKWISVSDGEATIDFNLPRQGVSLLRITW